MRVTAVYFSPFSNMTHLERETVTLKGSTLAELVETLAQKHGTSFKEALIDPHTGGFLPGMTVLRDGRRLDLSARLQDGDEVVFVMAIAGGS